MTKIITKNLVTAMSPLNWDGKIGVAFGILQEQFIEMYNEALQKDQPEDVT